ncbi:hypothetical protein SAMN05216410_0845 [Sanguibacter gelidistatuariae]|uniref:Uncharacterized protein n=1 Tax=Sanguibacter gelidistatuariae TaxID=1814289 RepID=A0A1G6H9J8_9MICO|nr:hypothetical protein [Sanguibacter gelidistatuariae]SDB90768.1 hypothetical protein SAMN05216410_0845 [Sanguibacter gelidistatuariae]
MTIPLDVATLRARLSLIDTDLADADAALASASTADWVSTSADLFRGELSESQRCITTIGVSVDSVRSALDRVV